MEDKKDEKIVKEVTVVKSEKPPYNNMTEAAIHAIDKLLNPSRERMLEFTNIPESMVFPIVAASIRQAAANPFRNIITDPLSGVFTYTYCSVRRSVGATRIGMMMGQLANSKMSATDSELGNYDNPSRTIGWGK